jgi:hypothetical protein
MPRSTYYRLIEPAEEKPKAVRPKPQRALSVDERQHVLDVLHEERFMDKAPAEVYAKLLDEGRYLCSISTMYRILHANKEVKERRDQLRHPEYKKPELLAVAANQVWSWDITKRAPRPSMDWGAYDRNARKHKEVMITKSALRLRCCKCMSPSGGDLLSTGRVT